MTREEKNAYKFWRVFYLVVLIVAAIAICLCSCTDHRYCNRHFDTGVVERVEKSLAYAKYKVCVKEPGMGTLTRFDYYWFYTNELLQVGDTVYIGKK